MKPKEFFKRVMSRRFLGGRSSQSRVQKECDVDSDDLAVKNDSQSRVQKECDVESDLESDDLTVKNDLLEFTSEDLSRFTGKFSPDNFIGVSQYGKLYRGKIPMGLNQENETTKNVCVKVLIDTMHFPDDKDLLRLEDEVKFLQHPRIRGNSNFMKLIGCCRKGKVLGVVYDLSPHDSLQNLIIRDDFNWLQRVNVALALARILNFLHEGKPPYLIRNLDPAHVVVDKDFNPILFDFGMVLGKGLDKTITDYQLGSWGYIDPVVVRTVIWSSKADVYAFGVLLLNLMSKRPTDQNNLQETIIIQWVKKEYKPGCSLVHQSLEDDPNFNSRDGLELTDLAMQCIDDKRVKRPQMKEVIDRLEAFQGVITGDSVRSVP